MAQDIFLSSSEWNAIEAAGTAVPFARYIFGVEGDQYVYQWLPNEATANPSDFTLTPIGPYSSTAEATNITANASNQTGSMGSNAQNTVNNQISGNNTMADNFSYDPNSPWAGYDWRGSGTYAPQFTELSPAAQYSSIMATQMPNYYMPGMQNMVARQFQPTYGRFLLGGHGGTGTGMGTGQSFADWYTPTQAANPAAIQQGWNIATQLAGMTPGSSAYDQYAYGQNAIPLSESLQNEADVRAMALSRYYGGQTPGSSYAARQTASAINNLYDRWLQRSQVSGQAAPSQFIGYLGGLNQDRFGAYA